MGSDWNGPVKVHNGHCPCAKCDTELGYGRHEAYQLKDGDWVCLDRATCRWRQERQIQKSQMGLPGVK